MADMTDDMGDIPAAASVKDLAQCAPGHGGKNLERIKEVAEQRKKEKKRKKGPKSKKRKGADKTTAGRVNKKKKTTGTIVKAAPKKTGTTKNPAPSTVQVPKAAPGLSRVSLCCFLCLG